MKRKLCFVISSMRRGGAERVMSLLLNSAIDKGNEVHLILLSDSRIDYDLNSQINVIRLADDLHGVRYIKNIKRFSILKKKLVGINPDLVVSFLTICNIFVAMALKNTKIPFIVSERNDPIKDCPSAVKRLLRNHYYRYADGVIFQTKDAKEYFSEKIQKKSSVIPNPVKSNLPFAEIGSEKKKIVAAARLMSQKNYPMMLKAFKIFLEDHEDYTLHIFGDGNLKNELISLTNELDISQNVCFEGNVNDLHDRIKDARMFVLSSDYEGISNSLLEALAMGLPCISTDCPCGGSKMLIENGVSGILTPVGDETAFADAMKKIADSRILAEQFSKNAMKIRDSFSEDVNIGKYFEYFEKILA